MALGTTMTRIRTLKCRICQAFGQGEDRWPADLSFWWLGQAGFLLRCQGEILLIDPYLSDCLARKYAQSQFKHKRLMQAPMLARDMKPLQWIFCTHRHSDHMDPEALPRLLQANPQCRVIAPAAEHDHVRRLGLAEDRVLFVGEGDSIQLGANMHAEAIASAHENLQTNEKGEDHYLGFVIRLGDITVYHSGDCVPYDGLERKLKHAAVDVAFLPVNGRDDLRRQHNIPGNFHFAEALALCRSVGIPQLVCHHFGMFAFNTVERDVLQEFARKANALDSITIPQVDYEYSISKPSETR
jgi:L-ascorbate metabolism protein UlaG (beta-lactamase superfamily)